MLISNASRGIGTREACWFHRMNGYPGRVTGLGRNGPSRLFYTLPLFVKLSERWLIPFGSEKISMTSRNWAVASIGLWILVFTAFGDGRAQAQVATVADAKAVLDLTTFPAVDAEGEIEKTVAWQSYRAKGDVEKVAQKVRTALTGKGLKQLDGAMFTSDYCSATYGKSGFHYVLTVMPSETGIAFVTVANIGNLDFRKLPIAKLGKELFVQPASAIFSAKGNVADTQKACRSALEKDGWEWFGETTVSFYMRKNAIRIQVMCSESPMEKGQSMIQVSAEQMSSTLPIIPDLVRVDYTESTARLDGDSKLSTDELMAKLWKALEKTGWTATTEKPLKIDFRETLIFRNSKDELVDLSIHQFESLSRFEMKYMTAEQVAAEDKLAQAAAKKAKKKMEAEKERLENPVAIAIELPESTTLDESQPQVLECKASSGKAKSVVTKWIAKQKGAGWTVESTVDTKEIGDYTLTKDGQTISVSFVDPGFIPAEITFRVGEGFTLEVMK